MIIYLIVILVIILAVLFFIPSKSNYSNDLLYNKFHSKFKYYNKGKKFDQVDMVYSIVMPDRKDYMINKLNQLNVNYTLFDAITPSDLSLSDYTALTNSKRFIDKKTRLPVQLSFTMCYINAIKNRYTNIIVFEDDLIINADFQTINNSINEFTKSNFVMFYMGYCELNCKQPFTIDKLLVNVPDYSKLWCCHSICYKVKYLPELINYIYPMDNEFDIKIIEFLKDKKYKVCIPRTVYFDQDKKLGTNNETIYANGKLILSGPTCVI